ncbi:MAG: hypothetical protein ACLP6E_18710 [Acidimicrobiales bacterium]
MAHIAGKRHRRWLWVPAAIILFLGAGCVVIWATTNRATQVTLRQAEARLHSKGDAPGARRPASGVYDYAGSGTEHVSFPPLSQSEGPTIPGTVTMEGKDCWQLRLDYSTHHWQTFNICLHGADILETGGVTWQLFSIGPANISTTSTFRCTSGTMWLPARRSAGNSTPSSCTGTSTSVKGETLSAGPFVYLGEATLTIGGKQVPSVHIHEERVDTGAQTGSERYDIWLAESSGLLLRFQQVIKLASKSPLGKVTYTQSGELHLVSLVPHN